ncbi:LacI family DNA-binding transcriptional regulator [Mammaliicoccus fleurettii]|uniref:LacI family DNA-binding transcriptional regulator n=1 Tax=Mammaliicoccus fleurettii TaxID=150056 RepID=UPI000DFC2840|nr:LacI family DNA-binding transcriptional regulator [Mammaliicoccus fleurettii]RTX89507.1 LacI family transcriptional regulator [Mammaliicoccus fleurettii]SUM35999.1 ribose operon repressor [Mammaliicoccus fleurettii]HCN59890.1 LacI family transcriptional regulator [Staphylococcus sp.]
MATIKQVAQYAGVSVATVSRALNKSGYVKKETQDKIDKAIQDLNYSPNETARTLYKRKSKMIGLLLPDISNPFFTVVARGVEDEAMAKGYHIILGNGDSNDEKELAYLNTFNVHNCSGIIASQLSSKETFDSFKSYNMPFVLLDRVYEDHEFVETNHLKGGQLQAEVIIKGKAKSVLILEQNLNYKSFRERFNGAKSVLDHAKVNYISANELELSDDELINMIKEYSIDSIICSNDVGAFKVMSILYNYNYNVPNAIQVVGYDDIPLSITYSPSLTTIHQPAYLIGKKACQQLIKQLEGKKREHHQVLDVTLVERQSTRRD